MEQFTQKKVPYVASESEKLVMEMTGELDKLEEVNEEDVIPYEESTEGLIENLQNMESDRATQENILDAINTHKADNDGSEPLNPEAIAGKIKVDTSDLDKAS